MLRRLSVKTSRPARLAPTVAVFGVEGRIGLTIARALGQQGVRCFGVSLEGLTYGCRSRHLAGFAALEAASPADGVAQALEVFRRVRPDFVMAASEPVMRELNRRRDETARRSFCSRQLDAHDGWRECPVDLGLGWNPQTINGTIRPASFSLSGEVSVLRGGGGGMKRSSTLDRLVEPVVRTFTPEVARALIRLRADPELQARVFRLLGLSDEEARLRFGFFLDALQFGTPPHGGIALGLDRLCALLAGESSIREVIAFPKTAAAVDLMAGAPSPVDERQLRELHIRIHQERERG